MVGGFERQTPMIVPSFSSRGFPDVKKIVVGAREYVTEQLLISAYDISRKRILPGGWDFADLVFVDSGGYEFGEEMDLSDYKMEPNGVRRGADGKKETWTTDDHEETLKNWKFPKSTVLISYDNPRKRVKFRTQINRARRLFKQYPYAASDILIKAEKKTSSSDPSSGFVCSDGIRPFADDLVSFDIVGVTEKELGRSVRERMLNIHKIRTILDEKKPGVPIHVFGSLDPISSHLYFLSGADIFDGLTWLRFAYHKELGMAVYRHNYAAEFYAHSLPESSINIRIHQSNHNYLVEMQTQMETYLNDRDLSVFGQHADLFRRCLAELRVQAGEV